MIRPHLFGRLDDDELVVRNEQLMRRRTTSCPNEDEDLEQIRGRVVSGAKLRKSVVLDNEERSYRSTTRPNKTLWSYDLEQVDRPWGVKGGLPPL